MKFYNFSISIKMKIFRYPIKTKFVPTPIFLGEEDPMETTPFLFFKKSFQATYFLYHKNKILLLFAYIKISKKKNRIPRKKYHNQPTNSYMVLHLSIIFFFLLFVNLGPFGFYCC